MPAVQQLRQLLPRAGAVQVGEPAGLPVPHQVVFAGLPGGDNLQPQQPCPGVKGDEVPGLVAVYQGVHRVVPGGHLVQEGAAEAVGLLGDHVDVDALL